MRRGLGPTAVLPLVVAALGVAVVMASTGSSVARTDTALSTALGGQPLYLTLTGQPLLPPALETEYGLEQSISRLHGIKAVYGPGTFVERAAVASDRIVRSDVDAARRAGHAQTGAAVQVRMGFSGRPAISNWSFVSQLVLGAGVEPKHQLAWLFPDSSHAVITVLARPSVSALALEPRIARVMVGVRLVGVNARVVPGTGWQQLARELHMRDSLSAATRAAEHTRALFATLARESRT